MVINSKADAENGAPIFRTGENHTSIHLVTGIQFWQILAGVVWPPTTTATQGRMVSRKGSIFGILIFIFLLFQTRPEGLSGIAMQYGPKLGSPIFREELAKFLSDGYGDTVKRLILFNLISDVFPIESICI